MKHEDYVAPSRILGLSPLSSKQKILNALRTLDEDASLEEAIEYLRILVSLEEGLAQLDAGHWIDHGEIKRRPGL